MSKTNSIPKKDKNPPGIFPRSMLRQIRHVRRLAREAGLFLNDRELLSCDSCGFLEDVDVTGRLITYKFGEAVFDSGMRFEKGEGDTYMCPVCGVPVTRRSIGEVSHRR
jgi:hypothetical protein